MEKLGSGAFGDVHWVKDNSCKLGRALKVLQQSTIRQSSPAPEVMLFREARALKHAKHKWVPPLIVMLWCCYQDALITCHTGYCCGSVAHFRSSSRGCIKGFARHRHHAAAAAAARDMCCADLPSPSLQQSMLRMSYPGNTYQHNKTQQIVGLLCRTPPVTCGSYISQQRKELLLTPHM